MTGSEQNFQLSYSHYYKVGGLKWYNAVFDYRHRTTTKSIQIKMKLELNMSGKQHIILVINMMLCQP